MAAINAKPIVLTDLNIAFSPKSWRSFKQRITQERWSIVSLGY
jgi:hypothetical protein